MITLKIPFNVYSSTKGFYSSYPSSFTPSSTGTCEFRIKKCSEDICQLRLDFQTLTGFTNNVGSCTDSFKAEGTIEQAGAEPGHTCFSVGSHNWFVIDHLFQLLVNV